MTNPQDETDVAKIERVMHDMIELHPIMSPSIVFPMGLYNEERGDYLALGAKLVAIQMIHGADHASLVEFCGEVLGLNTLLQDQFGLTENALTQMIGAFIDSGRNLLSCVERLEAGVAKDDLREQLVENNVFAEGLDAMLVRAEELVEYCRENGIGPYDHEHGPEPSTDHAGKTGKEVVGDAFRKLILGHDADEVSRELSSHGLYPGPDAFELIWSVIRESKGNDALLYQFLATLPAGEDARAVKQFGEYAMAGAKKGRRHRAFKTMESFLTIGRTSGKIGCFLPLVAIGLLIGLLFTPLSWWMSIIISIVAMFAMGFLRAQFDSFMVRSTAAKIRKSYPIDSEDYAVLHRLLSEAARWEENEGSDLKPLLERLPEPTLDFESSDPSGSAFHGFFYTADHETGDVVRLAMSPLQQHAFEEMLSSGGWRPLSEDEYWQSHYQTVLSVAHQGYVAWDDACYWVYAMDQTQILVIEFTPNTMRVLEFPTHGKIPGRFRNLLDMMRNWAVSGVGRCRQKAFSPQQRQQLDRNISWTDAMHQRMGELYPSE